MRGDGRVFRKKGSRYWHMSYWVRGHEVRVSTGEGDEKRAVQVLRRRVADVVRGEAVPDEDRTTLGELLDMLWRDYEINGRGWIKTVKYPMRHVAGFFGENTKAMTITTDRVQQYVQHRQAEGAANATINLELAVLGRAFTLAVRARRVRIAPFIPKLPADPSRVRQGFLAREEVEALGTHLPPDVGDAILFLFWSSWRPAEMRKLEWRDYDRTDGVIRLRGENSKTKFTRLLPVRGELAHIVERRLKARRIDCPFIFHRDGLPIGDIRKVWKQACAEVGLGARLVYDLRRSGVRHLIRSGVPPHTVMAFSGHRTASMLKRYDIISLDDLRAAADKGSAFRNEPGQLVALGEGKRNRDRSRNSRRRG